MRTRLWHVWAPNRVLSRRIVDNIYASELGPKFIKSALSVGLPPSPQMYYSEKGPYKRGAGGQAITFENSAVVVHGTMEANTYHPVLNISVIPQVGPGRGGGATTTHAAL